MSLNTSRVSNLGCGLDPYPKSYTLPLDHLAAVTVQPQCGPEEHGKIYDADDLAL